MIFIQIAGHLGQDPEVRYTPSGQKVTSIRVATNIKRGSKEKTVWWRVTMWGDRFDKRLAYLKKGSPVIAWGEMGIPDIYTDKDGNPQTSFEIIAEHISFSPFGNKDRQNSEGGGGSSDDQDEEQALSNRFAGKAATAGSKAAPASFAQDDDVPF
ncbi:MAG: single-stranded DNA-binding protein [Chlamydiales bacterium]|nr:single-stranded DNA-binding protein [Chlamydiales bacterium]